MTCSSLRRRNGRYGTYAKTVKQSHVEYVANEVVGTYQTPKGEVMRVVFRVSDNDLAFKYSLEQNGGGTLCHRRAYWLQVPDPYHDLLTPQATP